MSTYVNTSMTTLSDHVVSNTDQIVPVANHDPGPSMEWTVWGDSSEMKICYFLALIILCIVGYIITSKHAAARRKKSNSGKTAEEMTVMIEKERIKE